MPCEVSIRSSPFSSGLAPVSCNSPGDSEDETGGSAVVAIERNFLFVDEHFPHIIQIFADDYNHGARIYIGERTVRPSLGRQDGCGGLREHRRLVIVAGGEKVACQQDGEQHKRKNVYISY